MSNVKVSALPSGGTLLDTDAIPVVRAGVTDQVTTGTLLTDVSSLKTSRTTDEANITSLLASRTTDETNITNLQATVGPLRTALDQSGWAWLNQGGATVTQGSGLVQLFLANEVSENIRGRFIAAPASTPYTITALILPGQMTSSGTCGVGIAFRESGTSKVVYIAMVGNAGSAGPRIHVRKNTNETTNSTSSTGPQFLVTPANGMWLRISDNGTNVIYSYSFDGVNFTTQLSETRATFFTVKPNQVGIAIQNFGSNQDTWGSIASWVQT